MAKSRQAIEGGEYLPPSGTDPEQKPDTYKVGKNCPPRDTQFVKGRSGNPAGRPRGSRNMKTLLREQLDQKVTVREGGRTKRMTKAEIGAAKLANNFAQTGDPNIFSVIMKHLDDERAPSSDLNSASSISFGVDISASDLSILDWFVNGRQGQAQ